MSYDSVYQQLIFTERVTCICSCLHEAFSLFWTLL